MHRCNCRGLLGEHVHRLLTEDAFLVDVSDDVVSIGVVSVGVVSGGALVKRRLVERLVDHAVGFVSSLTSVSRFGLVVGRFDLDLLEVECGARLTSAGRRRRWGRNRVGNDLLK